MIRCHQKQSGKTLLEVIDAADLSGFVEVWGVLAAPVGGWQVFGWALAWLTRTVPHSAATRPRSWQVGSPTMAGPGTLMT